MINIGTVQD